MLLDFLITLFAGGVVIFQDCKKSSITSSNKSNASSLGKPYYTDGFGKKRSTETNEILFDRFINGTHELVGVKTGRVYYDWYQEQLDKKNAVLIRNGKTKFKYVSYPQWKDEKGRKITIRYDIEKGMPYMILANDSYRSMLSAQNAFKPRMAYVDIFRDGHIPSPDLSTERELTEKEYDMYTDRDTAPELHVGLGWH